MPKKQKKTTFFYEKNCKRKGEKYITNETRL